MKDEIKNGIMLGVFVIIILVIVYLATAIFMTGEIGGKKNKTKDNKTTTTTVSTNQYNNKIIADKIFNRSEESYMVVVFSSKNASNELKEMIKNYNGKTKLYVVNVDEAINRSLKADADNLYVQDSSSLKVKENALLIINGGIVTKAVTGGANIISELK